MATSFKSLYGTSNQSITITLASLTTGSARASTVVDNTTNLFLDALVGLQVKTGASGTSSSGSVEIYAYGTANGGSTYTENATGTDAAITLTVPPNAPLIGVINTVANATTYITGPFSIARAFGGVVPDHWGIIIVNKSGATLDTTEGNFAKFYQGIQTQGV